MKTKVCLMMAAMTGLAATPVVLATDAIGGGSPAASCEAGMCALKPMGSVPKAMEATEGVINTEALAALQRAKVGMHLLDARAGKYDDGKRIPGARALAPTASEEAIATMLPEKGALVITYCANLKCPASHMLGERLRKAGYTNVLEYHEGIEGWMSAGHPVEQVEKK